MTRCELGNVSRRTPVRVGLLAVTALLFAACGGSSAKPAADSSADTTTTAETTQPTDSPGGDDKSVDFVNRATEKASSSFTAVSCSRPDPLGLELVAKGTGTTKGTLTVHAANGTGTYKLTSTNTNGSGSVDVSAGPGGVLYLDKDIERATVSCGK